MSSCRSHLHIFTILLLHIIEIHFHTLSIANKWFEVLLSGGEKDSSNMIKSQNNHNKNNDASAFAHASERKHSRKDKRLRVTEKQKVFWCMCRAYECVRGFFMKDGQYLFLTVCLTCDTEQHHNRVHTSMTVKKK